MNEGRFEGFIGELKRQIKITKKNNFMISKSWRVALVAIFFISLFYAETFAVDVPPQEFADNFDNLTNGNIIGQNGWTSTGLGTASRTA